MANTKGNQMKNFAEVLEPEVELEESIKPNETQEPIPLLNQDENTDEQIADENYYEQDEVEFDYDDDDDDNYPI